eukprot:Hpha_TRINITY_DN3070_c0_g1::TRINITY_DN3070_c0_g1_i1::g.138583::m.138583/K03163/TOP1; DNA topoisomerase I
MPGKRKKAVVDDDSDDATPKKGAARKSASPPPAKRKGSASPPPAKRARGKAAAPPPKRKPSPPKKDSRKRKASPPPSKSKAKASQATQAAKMTPQEKLWAKEEEFLLTIVPEFEWWLPHNRQKMVDIYRRGDRFETLDHNGPIFAEEYKPHGCPVRYEGKALKLTPEEEEVATFFAEMRDSPYYKLATFRKNFWKEWTAILHKRPEMRHVKDLAMCDFDAMYERRQRLREERKSLSAAEKKRLKEELLEKEEKYKYCCWDGRKERIANFKVEPPGLFRGRGQHPKMGLLKRRIMPEQVTINVSDPKRPPAAPPGHKWKAVICNKKASWLAYWTENVLDQQKTVMLDKSSAWKQFKDMEKFDRAQRLCKIIGNIRADYQAKYTSPSLKERQMAVATYFIDRLALRVGGEKNEDEADTVGCCSLRAEHVALLTTWGRTPEEEKILGPLPEGDPARKKKFWIHFDFLGKDSIRYVNDMELHERVYNLVGQLLRGKDNRPIAANQLFDQVQPEDLNLYFKRFMPMLTAKVFRTYNASYTLDRMFKEEPCKETLEQQKLVYFNKANTRVAILCNHQKTVSKSAASAAELAKLKTEELAGLSKRLVEAYDTLLPLVGKRGFDAKWESLQSQFEKEEQEIQWDWLNKYGTEEEKADYRAELRGAKPKSSKSAAPRKSKAPTTRAPSPPKAKRARKGGGDWDFPEDEDVAVKGKKVTTKKPAPKKRGKARVADDDDSDDAAPSPLPDKPAINDDDSED